MIIEVEIVGFRDDELNIREPNHLVEIKLQAHSWESLDWQKRAMFLDEITDTLRHMLTKFGQAEYRLISNTNKGLDNDTNNN